MTVDERLSTLEALWAVWASHGGALTDPQWCLPTRLGDWDVRSLFAHAGIWPSALAALADRVTDADPTHTTAAALLRDLNAPQGVANTARERIAEGARADAARYGTEQMVEQFAGTGPRAIAAARHLGPVVVDYFGRAVLPVEEAISIGILEATVHLLDLQRALGYPRRFPPRASPTPCGCSPRCHRRWISSRPPRGAVPPTRSRSCPDPAGRAMRRVVP